jgi:hypothetical protein
MIDDNLALEEQHAIYHDAVERSQRWNQERDCPGDECSFFRDDDPAVAAERSENWRSYVQSE